MLPLTSLSHIYLILHLYDLTSSCLEPKQSLLGKYGREKAMWHAEAVQQYVQYMPVTLLIPYRTARLRLKIHSSSLLHSFPVSDFFLFFPSPAVPFLFSQISICFLNSFNWLSSCLGLFFVVGLFGGVFCTEKKIEKANSGSSFHFPFGL